MNMVIVRPKPISCLAVRYTGDLTKLQKLSDDVYVDEYENENGRIFERIYVDGQPISVGQWLVADPSGQNRIVDHETFQFTYTEGAA